MYQTSKSPSMPQALARYLATRSAPISLDVLMADYNLLGLVNRSTVYRWLAQARDEGLVEMKGSARSSVWSAAHAPRLEALREHLKLPLAKRTLVTYNECFLESYEPNETSYLTDLQKSKLHGLCPPGKAAFALLSPHDQSLFMCGISSGSSRLEGNRYELADTQKLLEDGLTLEGASPIETTMVHNHHDAVRYLVENIHVPERRNDVTVSARDIKTLHGCLSSYLLKDPMMCGAIRRGPVRIHASSYVPLAQPDMLERAFSQTLIKAQAIIDPFEQALFLLVHLPYIQPFEDCNKRTARVACNIPLLKAGVIPMSWLDVDHAGYIEATLGVYERTNPALLCEVFVDSYMRASERFLIMQKARTPNETEVRYRRLVRTVAHSVVFDGDLGMPSEVAPEDQEEFARLVNEELALLRGFHPAAMQRVDAGEGDIQAWMDRENPAASRRTREAMAG